MTKIKVDINPLVSIASAISNGFELLKTVIDTKQVRDMREGLDAAEHYILVNEGDSPYKDLSDKKKRKYLRHFKKRFIAYN